MASVRDFSPRGSFLGLSFGPRFPTTVYPRLRGAPLGMNFQTPTSAPAGPIAASLMVAVTGISGAGVLILASITDRPAFASSCDLHTTSEKLEKLSSPERHCLRHPQSGRACWCWSSRSALRVGAIPDRTGQKIRRRCHHGLDLRSSSSAARESLALKARDSRPLGTHTKATCISASQDIFSSRWFRWKPPPAHGADPRIVPPRATTRLSVHVEHGLAIHEGLTYHAAILLTWWH